MIPRQVCNAVFQKLHSDLRQSLNLHAIYPLLNCRHLLSSLDQSILTSPHTTTEKKVDIVISWLPKYCVSDYLTPFLECLLESGDEAGLAHLELAEKMKAQCIRELVKWDQGNDHALHEFHQGGRSAEGEVEADHPPEAQLLLNRGLKRNTFHVKLSVRCIISSLLIVALTITYVTTTVLFTSLIPASEQHILGDGMHIRPIATIPLTANWGLFRSLTLTFLDKNCTKPSPMIKPSTTNVFSISDMQCSQLDAYVRPVEWNSDKDAAELMYALPGSRIVIIDSENDTAVKRYKPNIWVPNYELFYDTKFLNSTFSHYRCADFTDVCFAAGDYPVIYNITKAGYYRVIVLYKNDTKEDLDSSIQWWYHSLVYDVNAIKRSNSINEHHFSDDGRSVTIILASVFQFQRSSCILLDISDKTKSQDDFSCVRIRVSSRWDIIILIFIVYILCVVLCEIGRAHV